MLALDRRRLAAVACSALALATASLPAQPRAFPTDSAIRAVLLQRVNGGISPGYAVGLIDSMGATRIITAGTGAGTAPIDAHTLFEIGSITKTFTGTILSSMVADKSVTLEQPVVELLPTGARVPARGNRQITLFDLATQSSGLPRMPGNFAPKDPTNPYADYDGAHLLAFLASYELPRDPGAQYEYSNLGVGLLGYALAARAKLPYEQLVSRRVLAPLGMRESAVTLTPSLRAHMATGHDANGTAVPLWDLDAIAGAGALRSSITDMLRYLEANLAADLNAADPRTRGMGAILANAHRERFPKGPPGQSLGLTWHRVSPAAGDTIVWHNGGTGGFTSFLGYSAQRKMGIVILTNSTTGPDGIALHWLAGTPLPPAAKPRNMTRAATTLPAETLDRYVGRFEITPAFALVVTRRGNTLTLTPTGQSALTLVAESPTRFFVREIEADFEYEFDAAGNAVALTLMQQGAKMRGARK